MSHFGRSCCVNSRSTSLANSLRGAHLAGLYTFPGDNAEVRPVAPSSVDLRAAPQLPFQLNFAAPSPSSATTRSLQPAAHHDFSPTSFPVVHAQDSTRTDETQSSYCDISSEL